MRITLRIADELADKIRTHAASAHRSLNAEIEYRLNYSLNGNRLEGGDSHEPDGLQSNQGHEAPGAAHPVKERNLADEIAKTAKPMQDKPKANSSILENVDLKAKPWCAPDSETKRHLIRFVEAREREPENVAQWEY